MSQSRSEKFNHRALRGIESKHRTASPLTDYVAIAASSVCAIYCATLPSIARSFSENPSLINVPAHHAMVILCCVFACVAFMTYWPQHRLILPACVGVFGLLLISLSSIILSSKLHESDNGSPDSQIGILAHTSADQTENDHSVHPLDIEAAIAPLSFSGMQVSPVILNELVRVVPVLGGLLLVLSHILNLLASAPCDCCNPKLSTAARDE